MPKWKRLALTDELTHLWNYRAFKMFYSKEFQRAKRHKYPLSLVFIDLDRFKKYNDKYGHIKGNKLLINLAVILKKNLRIYNYVIRYGGDEFILLLPHTDKEEAIKIIYRLYRKIKKQIKLQISYGVAEFPTDTKYKTKLLDLVDKEMYQSKKGVKK